MKIHQDPPDKFSPQSFCSFLVDSPLYDDRQSVREGDLEWGTFHQIYRIGGKLVAVGVLDFSELGLSSVYCFYDPDLPHLSLGKYTALREIEFVKSHSLRYYFLGFYIHTCPKMSYKGDYKPAELLCPTSLQWFPLEKCKNYLEEFSFTPFEASLAARRREVETFVKERIEHNKVLIDANKKEYFKDVGEASYLKELNEKTVSDNDDDSEDDSQEELLRGVDDLMKEFRPQFNAAIQTSLDDIQLCIAKGKTVSFGAFTDKYQDILRPMLEEWMSVCPPELLRKIQLNLYRG